MDKINVRNYLYHGILGANAPDFSEPQLYIFESMLKSGFIVDFFECKKYGIKPQHNTYFDMGYTPRISLGFYPLDEEIYSLSKKRYPDFYGKSIIEKIIGEHSISLENIDEFIMNTTNLNIGNSDDYAWCSYYRYGITLLLNKKILEDLKVSDFGMLVDEICIDEPISLRKYLEYVSIGDLNLIDFVKELLKKYNYNIPIIQFPSGEIIMEKTLVYNKK